LNKSHLLFFFVFVVFVTNFGLYLPSKSELPTTVTELITIAAAARIGSQAYIPAPTIGTKAPAVIGIKPVLYANAQTKFCFIFDTVFFLNPVQLQYLLYGDNGISLYTNIFRFTK
jgi:hypothetical protein